MTRPIREALKRISAQIAKNDSGYLLMRRSVGVLWNSLFMQRELELMRREGVSIEELILTVAPGLIVQNGPFAGLKYPDKKSAGSTLLPKLLGSYEQEIRGQVQQLLCVSWDLVVDVGCAEGYYAVGFARFGSCKSVRAFDIDEGARAMTAAMAALNGVAESVQLAGECSESKLLLLDRSDRTLIIADCEGCERMLFTKRVAEHLQNASFLIEAHERAVPGVLEALYGVFLSTHEVETVRSVDDIERPAKYQYAVLEGLSLAAKRAILAERRGGLMHWLIATPKEQ